MAKRPFLVAIIALTCLGTAAGQGGLSTDEVMLLLRLRVPSQMVMETLKRQGGPGVITESDLRQAQDLGADAHLLNALARETVDRRKRIRLARGFVIHALGGTDLRILVPESPTPWVVQRHETRRGILAVLRPHDHQGRDWLSAPGIARQFGLDHDRLRKRHDGWRKKNMDGWKHSEERTVRNAKYTYHVASVLPILKSLRKAQLAKEPSNEPPLKSQR